MEGGRTIAQANSSMAPQFEDLMTQKLRCHAGIHMMYA